MIYWMDQLCLPLREGQDARRRKFFSRGRYLWYNVLRTFSINVPEKQGV